MGDESKARAWEWAAAQIELAARLALEDKTGTEEHPSARHALEVIVPSLRSFGSRVRGRRTHGEARRALERSFMRPDGST